MSKWIAQVTVATPAPLGEQHLVTLDEAAERWDATVANRAEGPGFTLIIELDELDTIAAARTAVQVMRTVLGEIATGQVVGLRVCTPEQFETEALRPDFPPLASAADAAEILGVSRQRVHQLAASNTRFPAPVARVGTGPLWTVPAIEHFARVWDRRPCRPAVRVGLRVADEGRYRPWISSAPTAERERR
ncbi:MAG: hypothetical protein ACRDQZ_23975 [Mycobacteriales bacterium]